MDHGLLQILLIPTSCLNKTTIPVEKLSLKLPSLSWRKHFEAEIILEGKLNPSFMTHDHHPSKRGDFFPQILSMILLCPRLNVHLLSDPFLMSFLLKPLSIWTFKVFYYYIISGRKRISKLVDDVTLVSSFLWTSINLLKLLVLLRLLPQRLVLMKDDSQCPQLLGLWNIEIPLFSCQHHL